jgi:hypothetical protein
MTMKQDEGRVWVTLTLSEMLHGSNIGTIRHFEAQNAKRKPNHKFGMSSKDPLAAHIQGAIGEIVVAKARDRYFMPTVNNFKEADLGGIIQVRLRTKHEWQMIVRDDDDPNHIFVHVTGEGPEYCIRGWAYGRTVMLPAYRQNHGNRVESWFVPESALKSFSIKEREPKNDATA